ncbi:MAG: type II and III secretion system protein family protein [Xanthobacteraceae bacterium]
MTTGIRQDGSGVAAWIWDRKPSAAHWRATLLSLLATVTLGMLTTALPGFIATAQAQRTIVLGAAKRTSSITVPVGKSEDVRTDTPFVDISVGDAEIADVNPLTDKAISILGKKIGTTRVSIYGEGKRLIGIFDVEVSYDVSKLAEELRSRFPRARIRVSSVNGRIMLSGAAPDAILLDQALQVAKQFGPEVINSVQVASPQQVMLEVRFIEASRSAGRELGVQWNVLPRPGHEDRFLANIGDRKGAGALPVTAGSSGGVLSISPGAAAAGVLTTATPPFGFLVGNLIYKGLQADVLVNALEERGLARRLAEPNLVALSGDTANFLAGGEYPIPVPGAFGQISVDYKRYGVSLAFTPTVLGNGLINLKIEPEVSQLDPNHSVAVGTNITVPALIVRRASSTIELRDGQSFVLGGLLQNDSQVAQEQLPWLGDVPILGALFSSKAYQKNESDLVIIVTPRVVQPIRPGLPLKTPLDNTLPPNDVDLFIEGKGEIARKDVPPGVPERPFVGHMLDLPGGGARVSMR